MLLLVFSDAKFVAIIVFEDGNLISFQGHMLLFIITISTEDHISFISISIFISVNCLDILDTLIYDDPIINHEFLWFVFDLVFYFDIYIYSLLRSIPTFLLFGLSSTLLCIICHWDSLLNVPLKFYFFFCFPKQSVRSNV